MDRHNLEIRKLLKAHGLHIASQKQTGGHIKAVVTNGSKDSTIVFPVSPSDGRWKKNMESLIKKKFK